MATAIFTWRVVYFKFAQKVKKYFGYYCKKICSLEIKKITQSGHTAHDSTDDDEDDGKKISLKIQFSR